MKLEKYIETSNEKVFREALRSSALALGQLLGEPIRLQSYIWMDIREESSAWINFLRKNSSDVWMRTDLIGEVEGASFLGISEQNQSTLKNRMGEKKWSESPEMLHSFLKEIDNILSGSFIKVWADTYQLDIYGGIPQVVHADPFSKSEFEGLFKEDTKLAYLMHTRLGSPEFQKGFDYTWLLEESPEPSSSDI